MMRRACVRLLWPLVLVSLLPGCATFSRDGGFDQVASTVKSRTGKDIRWVKSEDERHALDERIAQLLQQPLGVDDAVQIALLNNRGLQASYAELGISEADLVQAGRLPNPRFSMLRASRDGEYKIEQALTFNIFSLVTMPKATAIERRRFEQTQRQVSLEVLRLANDTRKAYFTALAATQSERYMQQVTRAAETSATLAQRMKQAGNWSTLDEAREQGFYADATVGAARARQASVQATEQLTRLMGLDHAQYKLPERMPDLPGQMAEAGSLEQTAMQQRMDLQMMKLQTEALAGQLGLTKTTRFINVLELGPARVLEGRRSDPYKNGVEISLEIPLFDWGSARVARAESTYMQAVNLLAQTAVEARSQVREGYGRYRASYDIARSYRDNVVPIRQKIAEENQLRYNGMLVSVFDLLADARAQIASVNSYIEALRDFWLAQSDMEMSLIGKPDFSAPAAALVAQ
ncbi:TolC family protein [Methylovorus menthalis]|uniref:TolC family protein n=1 Tax=Methylovorus menthalis TaxID=1002227 RepID=UPI001E37B161|nr:TolC family protein [Methylovorus menthalis]MCB4810290.1 TolC family protein [Methylovorus menthalis]